MNLLAGRGWRYVHIRVLIWICGAVLMQDSPTCPQQQGFAQSQGPVLEYTSWFFFGCQTTGRTFRRRSDLPWLLMGIQPRASGVTCPEVVPSEQTSLRQSLQRSKKPEMHMVYISGFQHQLCSLWYEPIYVTEPGYA